MPTDVSCVIPAWNEKTTIGAVVLNALACPLISRVIVVDDGSTDGTTAVLDSLRNQRLKVLHQSHLGKSQAVYAAFQENSSQTVLLLDADLVGLTPENIASLIKPLKTPDTASFAFLGNAPGVARLMGINAVSGQRALPASILRSLDWQQARGFELELRLNELILKDTLKVKVICWPNVRHRKKVEKRGFIPGYIEDMKMTWNLISKFGLSKIIAQYHELSKRSKSSNLP